MMNREKVKHLVVDANSFIKNLPLQEMAEEIYSVPEIISEIRDSATRRRLNALPYEIIYKEPSTEVIQLIIRFSKATGDYPALSAVDIKLMALAYQLTQEKLGPDASGFLKTEPEAIKKITVVHGPRLCTEQSDSNAFTGKSATAEPKHSIEEASLSSECANDEVSVRDESVLPEDSNVNDTNREENEDESVLPEDNNVDDTNSEENEDDSCENTDEDEASGSESDDEDGWITPSNYKEKIAEMNKCGDEISPENTCVACLTTDFAMQNVMLHTGIKVLSSGGMLIKHLRTFILRCYACFRTTSIMTKIFCPSCGNKTLKRVSVSYNSDGTQVIHLSKRIQITGRGKKFSLPTPKGGKHANNPLLTEDQRFPQQRPNKMAMKKNNPLGPDYIANVSPFATKDVYSRAAMLGITNGYTVTNYWDKKNPNASHKSTGRRKKNRV